jgi:hypothetical protein
MAFVRAALAQRFDTDKAPIPGFLAQPEEASREIEQKEFGTRRIDQRIVIRAIKVDGGAATVDADRVLAVENVRSALRFPLLVTLGSVSRSAANPYGLVLAKVEAAKVEEPK